MDKEIEATFINIDVDEIRDKLKQIDAICVLPERLMKRKVFDFPGSPLQNKGGWVRVRDEGNKITTSYKEEQRKNDVEGTVESQVVIDSFESMCSIYEQIGLEQKAYQETKRESWKLGNVEIEIDTWPWIPTFLEVEGLNKKDLKKIADKLGLDWEDALFGDVTVVYGKYFNVMPEELYSCSEIIFSPVPQWLEQKRI